MSACVENPLFSQTHEVSPEGIPTRRVSYLPSPVAAPPRHVVEHRRIPRQDSKRKPVGVMRVVTRQMVNVAIILAQQAQSREDVLREQALAGVRVLGNFCEISYA